VHDVGPGSNVWTFVTSGGSQQFHVSGGFLANDVSAVRVIARSGYGIALLPLLDDLRSGVLVSILSEFPAPSIPLSLVYSSRRHLAPRTRVVFEFILKQARQVQAQIGAASDETRSSPSRADFVSSRTGN
jgi:DNA-binding transcriptional LysR family regulator